VNNAQKTPFYRSLSAFAQKKINDAIQLTGRALPCTAAAVNGAIITVNFEINSAFTLPQIEVPLFGPEYIRYPIQAGDKGFVVPADALLGAMSGLGSGVADLTAPANLGALVFLPIGNKNWDTVDPQSVTIYGPNGVVLYDSGQNSTLTLTPSGIVAVGQSQISLTVGSNVVLINSSQISLTVGGNSIVITSAGIALNGTITINGDVTTTTTGGSGALSVAGDLSAGGTATITGDATIDGRSFIAHEHTVDTPMGHTGGVI
jgi:hypothetical protein